MEAFRLICRSGKVCLDVSRIILMIYVPAHYIVEKEAGFPSIWNVNSWVDGKLGQTSVFAAICNNFMSHTVRRVGCQMLRPWVPRKRLRLPLPFETRCEKPRDPFLISHTLTPTTFAGPPETR